MEIIYIDQLFFINFIIDYFTILCAAKVSSAVIRRLPITLAALVGGAYACVCILPGWGFALNPLIKLAVGVLMCLIAFGRERQFFRCVITFLLVSAGFGGIVWAVSLFGGYDFTSQTFYLPLNWKVLALSFAAAYVVISTLFRRFETTARQECSPVRVTLNHKTIQFTALRDTGNSLYDPISNCSVMVCERACTEPLFPAGALEEAQDPAAVVEQLSGLPGLAGRMRLIPYHSVGGGGLLAAFRPDALTIGDEAVPNMLVAISDTKFSTYGEYQGIY